MKQVGREAGGARRLSVRLTVFDVGKICPRMCERACVARNDTEEFEVFAAYMVTSS